jgi:hypothetical protein
VSSLQLTLDEPLSPELALVCPELAERARQMQTVGLALVAVLSTMTPLALLVLERSPHFH